MRSLLVAAGLVIVLGGCNQSDNLVSASTYTVQYDSLQYTLATPASSLGIHDTLKATVTVHNASAETDTVVWGLSTVKWSLQDSNGRTIMFGPTAVNWALIIQPLHPGQSQELYAINQVIADTSGQPVTPGTYVLRVREGPASLSLGLILH